uniref:glycoside hydrolase family 18 protein n=1 Tax=uncultured Draconibacterium sp. TaxID=1573823 RepID=UPI003216810E
MKYTLVLIVALFFAFTFSACNTKKKPSTETENKYMAVAYVAGYRDFDFSTIDVTGMTHINYAFGNIRNGEAVFDTTKIDGKNLTPNDLVKLQGLKSKNPDLKILISIGGWSWSKGFSDAALTEESRLKFAQSCAALADKYNLDGIDLDWEYPNQVGAGNTHRPEDVKNFTLMLKACREQLDLLAKSKGNNKHYLLTIASGADKAYVDNVEMGEIHKYLDFLNIMTYDFYNGLHKVTGHHSNYMPSAKPELDMNSVVNAVDMHVNAGFPAKKINLGIPFYGRIWKGVKTDSNDPLFKDAETVGMGIDYINFYQDINANGYTRYWDDNAKAPYLWNAEEKTFISYEDEESIKLKVDYLKNRGLAGVMFWEYSGDHEKTLLNALVSDLNK